jgi:RNA polymerase sigma factor (sigma-70 family)
MLMNDVHEFRTLMERVQQGDQEAARQLLEGYEPHVVRVIRRKLHKKLRKKYDSADFAQAVWASFFAVDPAEYQFDHPKELITYLVKMAQHKVIEEVRHRMTGLKHNIGREISLEAAMAQQKAGLRDPRPTPSKFVAADDQRQQLLSRLPPAHRQVLLLIEQGYTHREVAEKMNLNERTIRRLLEKLSPKDPANDKSGESASVAGH